MGRKDSLASGDLTDTHYYILLVLMAPKYGYVIMQTIADLTEGQINLGPGLVYPMTQKLLHADYIELWKEAEQQKAYIITEAGMDVFQREVRSVFTAGPYFGYQYKVRRLRKKEEA